MRTTALVVLSCLGYALLACGEPKRDFLELDTKEEPAVDGGAPPVQKCQPESSKSFIVFVQNDTAAQVSVFEVAADCQTEELRGNAPAGAGVTVTIFATHIYRVRDSATRALLKEFQKSEPGQISIP